MKTVQSSEKCRYSGKCGGCQYQGIPYEEQLKRKQTKVRKLLEGICKTAPVCGMEHPLHYRNKVHAAFGSRRDGSVFSGIFEMGSRRIVPVRSCGIEFEEAAGILATLCKMAEKFQMPVYRRESGKGLLRYALLRKGFSTGQILLVLVLTTETFAKKNEFVKALELAHPEITSMVINYNRRTDSLLLGPKNVTVWGKGSIEDVLCGMRFRISPHSFYQINPLQTEKLYAKAIELAKLKGRETVVDAYCGIGTIGMIASPKAGKVLGIEFNRAAVKDAMENADRNQVRNIEFIAADAGEYLQQMAGKGQRPDVILMDPPRAGSSREFLGAVGKLHPPKVVYISCNPETLARDLRILKKYGYGCDCAYPFDLFPWTNAVEVVVLLTRTQAGRIK